MPRTSGAMYAVWEDGTTIEGKNFNGTSWDASPTTINSSGLSGLANNMSAVADSSGNVHLTYVDSSGYVRYQEFTTSWQTAVSLDTNASNAYTSISLDTSTGDLYAVWIRGNNIYYKKGVSPYASANWDVAATDWKSTGTNTWVTTNYSGSGRIFAEWTVGVGSPYSISFGIIAVPENLLIFFLFMPFLPLLIKERKRRKNLAVLINGKDEEGNKLPVAMIREKKDDNNHCG